MQRIRQRVEETYREMQRKLNSAGASGGSSKDLQSLTQQIEQRLAEFEEKLGEKANKQSVAQALHRKANRPEIETILAKKADLSDLQRVIAALENKIDIASFESLVRAVEAKADRHELHTMIGSGQSYRPTSQDGAKGSVEVERLIQQVNNDRFELERRFGDLERQLQLAQREAQSQVEQVKSVVTMNLQQKVEFRDIDQISHHLHTKADVEKVQELVSQLRQELVTQLTSIKKDVTSKTKKKDEELKKKKKENEFTNEKLIEEIKAVKDKLQKLAA